MRTLLIIFAFLMSLFMIGMGSWDFTVGTLDQGKPPPFDLRIATLLIVSGFGFLAMNVVGVLST